MLRLPSLLQAILLVIVAVVSCVNGLGLQDPSAISELHQGQHDTEDALSIGVGTEDNISEVSGAGRDLQGFKKKKKTIFYKPPKKKFIVKPKKKIFFPKTKKKKITKKPTKFFFHKKFFKKKKF